MEESGMHVLSELEEANSKLCAVLTAHPDISSDLASIKVAFSNAHRELEMKQRAKQFPDKDALPPPLEPKVRQLEQELEGRHESEMRLLDSLLAQTKQLEETKISLEESKLEISSLKGSFRQGRARDPEILPPVRNLSYDDLRSVENDLAHAKEREKVASLKAESLADQLKSVKSQLELVAETEEHEKKAMDELALALKEVAAEASDAKEQVSATQKEAEESKSEAEQSKLLVKSMRSKFRVLLDEARNDAEKHQDTSERLTREAEESLSAWQQKETMLVEQLSASQKEAEESKSEAEQSKLLVKSMRSKFRVLLDEARHDAEEHQDTSERLTREAEESLVAWQQKETTFLECIKNAEQENSVLREENTRLVDALADAKSENTRLVDDLAGAKSENTRLVVALAGAKSEINTSKEESEKQHDILKQEANDAKEAVTTASEENSQLKDNVAQKESALEKLNQEIESLRAKEALAKDNAKELKKLLRQTELAQSGFKTMEGDEIWKVNTHQEKEPKVSPKKDSNFKKLGRNCSMIDVKSALSMEDLNVKQKDTGKDEALKGSIFDMSSPSPMGHGPSPNRTKSLSLSFAEDTAMEYEQQEQEQEGENEKHRKKKKTLFKKFGSMLSRRRSFQRKEHDIK